MVKVLVREYRAHERNKHAYVFYFGMCGAAKGRVSRWRVFVTPSCADTYVRVQSMIQTRVRMHNWGV